MFPAAAAASTSRIALAFAVALSRAQPLNLEVYHINPYHYGPVPINMNTGDVVGDLFFDLKMVLMAPLACADPHSYLHKDCQNKESNAPDLVVNKLHIQAIGPPSGYGLCNVGLDNNTDPYGWPCPRGRYCCVCGNPFAGDFRPCNATVGRQAVKPHMHWPPESLCNASAPEWMCWQTKLTQKLADASPGYWYSTLDSGYCPHHPGAPANCTWRVVSVDKVVNKTCHAASFFDAVEAYDRACFAGCGRARNVSSPCWTRCFYRTALGPEAGRAGGAVAGVPMEALVAAWTAPFWSEDPAQGGCPALPAAMGAAIAAHRAAEEAPEDSALVV